MVWKILIVIALILSVYSVWGMWQNTKASKSILGMIDELNNFVHQIIEDSFKNQ